MYPVSGIRYAVMYACVFQEELEETAAASGAGPGMISAYEDYKFVTREELTRLGLAHMIGTPALKVCACIFVWT